MDKSNFMQLFPGCNWIASHAESEAAIVQAGSWDAAMEIHKTYFQALARLARDLGKREIRIEHNDPSKPPLRVMADFANCGQEESGFTNEGNLNWKSVLKQYSLAHFSKTWSDLELDFNALNQSANAIYISQLEDQTNLYANRTALLAQGKKPKEFLGQSACALNDEEELARRCHLIYNDGGLNEYGYSALRWFHEPSTGFWRRKRMNFISNFRKLEYLGELCWIGEVLVAEETGSIL